MASSPLGGVRGGSVHGELPRPCDRALGTLNREQVRRHRQGAAGILPAVLSSDWPAGKMPAAPWGSWRVTSTQEPASYPLQASMQQFLADSVRSKIRRTIELLALGSQGATHQGRRVRGPSLVDHYVDPIERFRYTIPRCIQENDPFWLLMTAQMVLYFACHVIPRELTNARSL